MTSSYDSNLQKKIHKMLPGSVHYDVLIECMTIYYVMSRQKIGYNILFRNTKLDISGVQFDISTMQEEDISD